MRCALLLGLSAILLGSPAFAQADAESKAAAEMFFREGMTAFNAGDYATACPKLESAVALTGGEALGGALLLAKCYEKQGKLASAWGAYSEVAGKARAAGQTSRAVEAESGVAAVTPRLHYISLRVPAEISALAGVEIRRQGKPLRRELWAARLPVDPGSIAFEVTAPGKRTARLTVQIPDAPGETPIAFEPLADEPQGAAQAPITPQVPIASTPTQPPSSPSPDGPPRVAPSGSWSGPRIAGAVIASAGVVGIGVGIGIGALAKTRYEDALADPRNGCGERAGGGIECTDRAPSGDARALGDAGTVTFFVGAGAAVGGAVLFLLAPSSPRAAASLPRVTFGRDGGGVTWIGAF